MKKLFLILLTIAVLAACATAPEQSETVVVEETAVEETVSENSGSVHAKNSYFVIDDKFDITIKFRDADLYKSLSIPLSVGPAFEDISKNPEMEADISPYGIKYSWAIKVKPKVEDYGLFADLFEPSLESYAALYPHLLDIGLPADTVVEPVGGLTVLEEKIEPAILVLDCGAEMEVAFSTFFIKGEALVAEVSYDFDTEYKVKDKLCVRFSSNCRIGISCKDARPCVSTGGYLLKLSLNFYQQRSSLQKPLQHGQPCFPGPYGAILLDHKTSY